MAGSNGDVFEDRSVQPAFGEPVRDELGGFEEVRAGALTGAPSAAGALATRSQVENLNRAVEELLELARETAAQARVEPRSDSTPSDFDAFLANSANRFYFFDSTYDAVEVVRRHGAPDPQPDPEHLTNYLGVKIPTKIFPPALAGRENEVEAAPIPSNWHADIAEFAAAFRAIDMAGETFRMLELGCGWGCWMNLTGVAALNSGRAVHLVGIEGDAGHVAFARETLALNGLDGDRSELVHGIAGPLDGKGLFPRQDAAGGSWGLEPVLQPSEEQIKAMAASHELLDVHTLRTLGRGERFDLVHIDIQGGEFDFVESCLADINAHVRFLVIGTHSRTIEGKLMDLLLGEDWVLEVDRPAIYARGAEQECLLTIDGVHGWRNRRFDA